MARATVQLPDELVAELRERVRTTRRSLSSLLVDIARAGLHPSGLDESFHDLFGSWEGGFPIPADPSPDET